MVYARLAGGLGNQLFQYAAARAIAHRLRVELRLDTTFYAGRQRGRWLDSFRRDYLLSEFAIQATEVSDSERPLMKLLAIIGRAGIAPAYNLVRPRWLPFLYREPHFHYDPASERVPDRSYMHGYWQSERYFAPVADLIRRELRVKDESIARAARDRVRAVGNGGPVVSLHVRRGDALVPGNDDAMAPFRPEYIEKARAMFGGDAMFIVFSDDIAWCQANIIGDNITYADGKSAIEDFVLMSSCHHNVITTSTFSWWAAWLNPNPDKIVVAPNKWFGPRWASYDTRDLLPPVWRRA